MVGFEQASLQLTRNQNFEGTFYCRFTDALREALCTPPVGPSWIKVCSGCTLFLVAVLVAIGKVKSLSKTQL
jgi:hypothetical protein